LGVGLLACSPAKPAPVAPAPAPAVTAEIAEEAPDLSPVAAPAGVFGVGRIVKPLAISDTVLGWAGLPIGLRELLPERTRDLERAIAWEAPVEFALVLASSSPKNPVQAFVSVGLTSVEAAKQVASERGYQIERIAPGVFAVGGLKEGSCAIAPALGAASARLVCASRRSELEEVIPYATRGLPNERFGGHDFDLELRVEPVRQKFGTALSSARLFAGFLLSRVALDVPRFDSAVSDATYALADEVVALVGDLDVLRAAGTLDKSKQVLGLDVTLTFRSKKSFTAGLVEQSVERAGPAPDALFRLPADATSGGFSYAVDPKRWDGPRRVLTEILDAYLEHEKVKAPVRERARRSLERLVELGYPVTAFADGAAETGPADAEPGRWHLVRSELPIAKARALLGDFHAILSDRTLRTALARRFHSEEKGMPTAKLGPLSGPGVPAGTQVLTFRGLSDVGAFVLGRAGLRSSTAPAPEQEYALAVVADGTGSLLGVAPTAKELALRLGQVASGKGPSLGTREELAVLKQLKASTVQFTSVAALVNSVSGSSAETKRMLSALPNHGRQPIVIAIDAEAAPLLTARLRTTVPAAAFADLPGLAPLLLDQLGSKLMKP
jgi:hypothetical protein